MKGHRYNFFCALLALLLLPTPGFALDLFGDADVVWQDGRNEYVRFARQDDVRFGSNDHPVELDVTDVGNAMGMLAIKAKASGAADDLVFTPKQSRLLSQHLVAGLGRAGPGQDLVFALESSAVNRLGMRTRSVFVAGRAFYKDSKLNLIIGEHDQAKDAGFEGAYDPTHLGIVSHNFVHGNRASQAKTFKKSIAEGQGVVAMRVDHLLRGDWALLDLQQTAQAVQIPAKIERAVAPVEQPPRATTATPPAATPASRREPVTQMMPPPAAADQSIAARLTTLEDLKSKGLISAQEYADKRKQILDAL